MITSQLALLPHFSLLAATEESTTQRSDAHNPDDTWRCPRSIAFRSTLQHFSNPAFLPTTESLDYPFRSPLASWLSPELATSTALTTTLRSNSQKGDHNLDALSLLLTGHRPFCVAALMQKRTRGDRE